MSACKHALEELTFVEFKDRLTEQPRPPVVLLPFGSHEEQGPHAPMGDFMLTRRLALMAAEAADAIAAPTVPFGHADFFRTVPGGIQLRATTFTALFEDVAGAFLDHGVEHLLVLNGHTANAPLIDEASRRIRRDRGVAIPSINLWRSIPEALWRRLHGDQAGRARGHGGDPVTSVYLHLFPGLVRLDLARPSAPGTAFGLATAGVAAVTFDGLPVQLPLDVHEVNPDGMLGGDAGLASATIGAELTRHLVDFTARFIAHFRRCDPRAVTLDPAA